MFLTSGGTLPHLQEKNVLKRLVLDNPDYWLLLIWLSRGSKGFSPCQKTTYRSPRPRRGFQYPLNGNPVWWITVDSDQNLNRKKKRNPSIPVIPNNSDNRIPVGFNPWWNVKEKRTSNVHLSLRTLLSGIQVTRWWVYPSHSALMRVRACVYYTSSASVGLHTRHPDNQGTRWKKKKKTQKELSFPSRQYHASKIPVDGFICPPRLSCAHGRELLHTTSIYTSLVLGRMKWFFLSRVSAPVSTGVRARIRA